MAGGPPKGHPPYNKNGEGGRPRIYTEDFVNDLAEKLEEWIKEKDNIFIEKFCLEMNVSSKKVTGEFIKHHRFCDAYDKLKEKQKLALFEGGLKRKYAHPMCALILSHNHGVYQKNEQKLTGDVTNPLHFIINNTDGLSKDLVDESE